jgi:AraC-like DNA-binding protein
MRKLSIGYSMLYSNDKNGQKNSVHSARTIMNTDEIVAIIEDHNFDEKGFDLIYDTLSKKQLCLEGQTRRRIEILLRAHQNPGDISSDFVADSLYISNRTLYRRLKNENITFGKLMDNERKRRCITMLENNMTNGVKISDLLGFSEPAYFYQKFEKWTGVRFKTAKQLLADNPENIGEIFDFG